jgi:hypothetical protein
MKVTFLEKNLKYIIFVISIFFIGIGILREEQLVVLNKAVNICLECIGVG